MPVGGSLLLPFQIFVPDPLGDLGPISVDERFSTLLSTLMPQYVQDDHQKFIAFLRAYFEYLEIHGNPRAEAVRLGTYTDIDRTLEDFVQYFKSTYLSNFPDDLASGVSDTLAVKNSNDFYGEKGNSLSINYLFKVLFNLEASVDTPKDKLFKISDSDYQPNTVLFTSHYNGKDSITDFKGSEIEQRILDDFDSDVVARALIDDITFHLDDGVEYAKIFLKEVRGKFKPNQYVEFFRADRNRKLIERTFSIVSNLSITDKGRNYAVGDDITVKDSSNKLVLTSEVKTVNSLGEIQSVSSTPLQNKLFFPGESYTIEIFSGSGVGAGLTLDGKNATSTNRNNFTSSRSLLSSESFIQDNFKFQSYSYVIQAEKQLKEYADLVKRIFHPAGSVMLAEFTNSSLFSGVRFEDVISVDTNFIEPVIGNFLPYTFAATADFRGDTFDIGSDVYADFYPDGFNGITAATVGNFDGLGNPAKHDPYNNDTFDYGPIGGITFAGVNPDVFFDGTDERPGYRAVQLPQIRYRESDSANDPYYQISRHPKTLFTQELPARKKVFENLDPVTNKYTKNFSGQAKIIKKTVRLYLDNSAGIIPGFAVDDVIRQSIPNMPEAIGVITSIDEIRDSQTSFYTNTSVAEIISNFNKNRSALDLGADVEVVETVSEREESPVASRFSTSDLKSIQSLTAIENTDSSLLSFAESQVFIEVDEITTRSVKTGDERQSLALKSTNKTPSVVIKENPTGKFQESVKTSEVIQPKTLKALTLNVEVISGQFSNQTDRDGNRFPVLSSSGGESLLATGLNKDKSVKGTAAVSSEEAVDVSFNDVRIGEFLNYLESPNDTLGGSNLN